MIKIKTMFLAALLSPIGLNAASLADNKELARKCHQLSKELHSLMLVESVPFCKEKIRTASNFSEMAGQDLIGNSVSSAKITLQLAIRDLAYSAMEECIQETNIDNKKNELQKIHDALP